MYVVRWRTFGSLSVAVNFTVAVSVMRPETISLRLAFVSVFE